LASPSVGQLVATLVQPLHFLVNTQIFISLGQSHV
jgi:hypothetical protein